MFNGERLKIAREIHGLTQAALAETTGLDQPFISLAEQTAKIPSDAVLETLSLATGFPKAFFELGKAPDFPLGSLLFRKKNLSKADAGPCQQAFERSRGTGVHLGAGRTGVGGLNQSTAA